MAGIQSPTSRVESRYAKFLVEVDSAVPGACPNKLQLSTKGLGERSDEGFRLRTRAKLTAVISSMKKSFKAALDARRAFSLSNVGGKDLLSLLETRRTWLRFLNGAEALVQSGTRKTGAESETLHAQLSVMLCLAVQMRQLEVDLFRIGKNLTNSEGVATEFAFLAEGKDELRKMVSDFVYAYASRAGGEQPPPVHHLGLLSPGNKRQQAQEEAKKVGGAPPLPPRRSVLGDRSAGSAGNEENQRHDAENSAPQQQSGKKTDKTAAKQDADASLRRSVEVPIMLLEERLQSADVSADARAELLKICPQMRDLRKMVMSFLDQGLDVAVIGLYVANTIGLAVVTLFKRTKLRRQLLEPLTSAFASARGVAMMLLAVRGVAMPPTREPTAEELQALLVKKKKKSKR